LEANTKQEIITSLELDSEQFTIYEMHRFQTCSSQLGHRKIAINELAIHKTVVREITIREIAILENTIFKFPVVDFGIDKEIFFECCIGINQIFH